MEKIKHLFLPLTRLDHQLDSEFDEAFNDARSRVSTILLPHAHAQGIKQSSVCLASVVITDLEFQASVRAVSCNYHELADIGEKRVSVCFELLNMAR